MKGITDKMKIHPENIGKFPDKLPAAGRGRSPAQDSLADMKRLRSELDRSKKREDEFRKSESYLRDFFDKAPIGFHVFGPDQVFIDINQSELDMIGYERSEVIGRKKWADLIIPDQRQQFENHWKEIITKGIVKDLQYTIIRKDGQRIDVILNASARFDKKKRLMNTRGSVIDVTRRCSAERELERHLLELERHKDLLEKKNVTLSHVFEHIQEEKNSVKRDIKKNIEYLIYPVLERLRKKMSARDRLQVDLLKGYLEEIASRFQITVDGGGRLSPKEMEICHMIKKGLSTKEIAETLNTSRRTVDNHRNHIRKKLNLSGKKANLASHLQYYFKDA